ncbi:hypothetical protein FHG66_17415 [Rubellimicrobium rubrum]|uniref:Uncharacterized protein n=1 Tax=Rubellimicrobium rubrum TaxID=2585369 RepID=A0A5C4MT80_9RHOB|nr:hypothetical protein [Rubellimicrobium rubrum]TNC46976.1 hypothetical protein FHG66_17415 [Rubellimicrobium rubrum]
MRLTLILKLADNNLGGMEEAPKVGMHCRPEHLRGAARHDGQFIVVPAMRRTSGSGVNPTPLERTNP